jgi:hypothetical protein
MPHVPASLPFSGLCDLFSWDHAHTSAPADARASASRIPMLQAQPHPEEVMAGPASRSRLASRFPEIRGRRSEIRPRPEPSPIWDRPPTPFR